jgi:hypothetical protein
MAGLETSTPSGKSTRTHMDKFGLKIFFGNMRVANRLFSSMSIRGEILPSI